MNNDIIQHLTMSDYLAHPAFGSSDIIKMARSFAHWKYRKANPEKPGRALVVGSVTHALLEAAITGQPTPSGAIITYTEGSWRTKGFEKFCAENPKALCVDLEEMALCDRMIEALTSEPAVIDYLTDSIAEPTILAKWPGSDVQCKVRPDYFHVERGLSINLKTCTDSSESGFIYGAKDYYYDFQSAFYIAILSEKFEKPFDEIHILVEKTDDKEPCPVKIYSFGDETIAWARSQIQNIIDRIPECERTNVWPKSPAHLEVVELPLYARKLVQL